MARIAVVGLGPVGLASGLAFALQGHAVVGIDVDTDRTGAIARGAPPFYEDGLEEALRAGLKQGRFSVTDRIGTAVPTADYVFLCVGTPSRPDGSMDDRYLQQAARDVAAALPPEGAPVVVVKSTVIPGTTDAVVRPPLEASGRPFHLAMNPEFLREGRAWEDATRPDRIVVGANGPEARTRMRALYADAGCPVVETDIRTAEMIKYATNAFLATKVAFANELANLCQAFGVGYDEVIRAVTLDPRINPRFLVPGVGFGGSCFPKDVRALVAAGRDRGVAPPLLEAVLAQNEVQYLRAIDLLEAELGDVRGMRIALLGLAFKGGTDDLRESRAIPLARTLIAKGAAVVGYDPLANDGFARLVPEAACVASLEQALRGADGCILQAEWPELTKLTAADFLRSMRRPVVVDGRRILDPAKMQGIRFRRIG